MFRWADLLTEKTYNQSEQQNLTLLCQSSYRMCHMLNKRLWLARPGPSLVEFCLNGSRDWCIYQITWKTWAQQIHLVHRPAGGCFQRKILWPPPVKYLSSNNGKDKTSNWPSLWRLWSMKQQSGLKWEWILAGDNVTPYLLDAYISNCFQSSACFT